MHKHNQVKQLKEMMDDTMKITWLSILEIKAYLKEYTHTEIRRAKKLAISE